MGGKIGWALQEGDELVPGRTVLAVLGGGSRFEVYLVADEALMATAVAKVLRPDQIASERARAALRREATHLSSLAHPSLVRMFDAVLDGDRPHLLLEHLEGPTLRSLVRRYGPLPPDQLVPLAIDLCSALHFLHGRGVVHLDVKPSNVLMAARPMLLDLSVARTVEETAALDRSLGSQGYIAPEIAAARGGGTPADIWSLGVTVWEAATGEKPPGGPTRGVPAPVVALLERCLRDDPAERPAAAEVAADLEPLLAALPRVPVLRHGRPRLA